MSGCPAFPRRRKVFAGVDVTKEPIPVLPTVHYNMGGIPTNYHGEVLSPTPEDPDRVVPGLMAVGECACVSVHGANRLGTNSLLDLVVFGRAAAHRAAETIQAGATQAPLPARAGEASLDRFDADPPCQGRHPRLRTARRSAARHAGPCRGLPQFGEPQEGRRQGAEGLDRHDATWASSDRSLIWNSDLVEALELQNLMGNGDDDDGRRRGAARKPRRPCP